jgi:hypothetical protein
MADPPQKATVQRRGRQRGYTLRYPASPQWAIACTVFLILMGLAFAVDFLVPDLRDLPFLRDELPIADSELRQNHTRLVVITKVAIVVGALTAITWLIWQFLAHANAQRPFGSGGVADARLGSRLLVRSRTQSHPAALDHAEPAPDERP